MAYRFFDKQQEEQIVAAIKEAELTTSGEIRVHVEARCKADTAIDRALYVFEKLDMHETAQRNAVLFYLAGKDHKFAILGDEGINKVVPDHFWDDIKDQMSQDFKAGRFAEGLSKGILTAGEQLQAHFPYQDDDQNELPDQISTGDV